MHPLLHRSLSVALSVAALTLAGLVVARELPILMGLQARPAQVVELPPPPPPSYIDGWRQLLQDGILHGNRDAEVTVIEFIDLQCPYCRLFHQAFARVKEDLGDELAIVYIHYPLPMHPEAIPAARAFECAESLGRGPEFVDVAFRDQLLFSRAPWLSLASEAGIADAERFAECLSEVTNFARIDAGMAIGDSLGVTGTPTVIINGWMFPALSADSLPSAISRLRAGVTPDAG